jgi:hypothetical protein
MNRGVEMAVDPSELPGSVIIHQVTNGVAVRMAVLFELLGSGSVLRSSTRRRGRLMPASSSAAEPCSTSAGAACRRRDRRRRRSRASRLDRRRDGDEVLDAAGCHVTPGLRRPARPPPRARAVRTRDDRDGQSRAALGGFTAVVAMPNTDPPHDSLSTIEFVRRQARAAALCEVAPAGCITIGRAGVTLARSASSRARVSASSPTTATAFRTPG